MTSWHPFPFSPEKCPHEKPFVAGLGGAMVVVVCKQCGSRWINEEIPDEVRAIIDNAASHFPPKQ